MTKGQAERLLVICEELLAEAGISLPEVDVIGVGTGPGNFTGIRISVSAARGLALGLGVPAVGVTAFDALGYGQTPPFACAIDARRDHVYFQSTAKDGSARDAALFHHAECPTHEGPLIGAGGDAAAVPTAVAIAHIAAKRRNETPERPAPFYIRPADAAPAKDAPPMILT
ncbi:N6-L-threonylcarbamoyladenine synthase [Roseobacter denitrificans OCh 114]|nr:N6-L-threonylcarbamoyladenine synthase [Roseobacter denitrificans OCh 114]